MYKKFFFLFSIMPLPVNHLFGYLIGLFTYLLRTETKKVITKNIQLCFPNLSEKQRKSLIYKAHIENGKTLTESSKIWLKSFKNNKKLIKSIKGIESLKSKRPLILMVPHYGCWEITGRIIAIESRLTFMYKKLDSPDKENYLLSKRQQGNLSMATADRSGVIKLQKSLKSGEIIGILPDQFPGIDSGERSSFFGQDAYTMTLLVKLAKKNNAKVILTWAERLSFGRGFKLNLEPVDITSSDNEIENLNHMNSVIENLVLIKPEQYLWSYKRFKGVIDYNSL
jgi:KDO2-lipid IV(A) lauroyltransferase